MIKIAIVDPLGLTYDGSTLEKRGLGGSESAVIQMSRNLVREGFDVTVYNDCTSDDSQSGNSDGVHYQPIETSKTVAPRYDVVIVSRTVRPFLEDWQVLFNVKHKVLWMHDTFCEGDDQIEDLILGGKINEIFTLSDWHTSYVTNCDHGKRRNFDVLKRHIYQTRNGINAIPKEWIDVKKKDPNLYVYNASVTKGMVPLVENIWPEVKKRLPSARLKVIGGYYRFREAHGPDQQELDWREMVKNHPEIEFTGVISQNEISNILTEASYMIYPAGFPETFGISTLEALAHNVPIITCNFGALEETAIDIASYKIPYPVEPNWATPWLNKDDQVRIFVDAVVSASEPYLHQQKMYACNQVKDICGWDSVAKQWKQHFYKVLNEYLPIEDYHEVTKINNKVSRVFGRRFTNPESMHSPSIAPYNMIRVITPVYNAKKYIEKCIRSVASQNYNNYEMVIIDDASTDNTFDVVMDTINSLDVSIRDRFIPIRNTENVGALANQVKNIGGSNGITMLLDGDDWLVNDPNIFHYYNELYNDGAAFTYGSCLSLADNIPLIAQEYPPEVKENRSYREYKFNWNMPYTHMRTFDTTLFHSYEYEKGLSAFKDEEGNFFKAGGDGALFYEMIEYVNKDKIVAVPHVHYIYNDLNPINDYKINSEEQTKTANKIIGKNEMKKRILVAIPTAKYIEPETFKSIYNMRVPDGFETEFQYFYGYQIDQVRNLMASWALHYDYIFFVDSDISFRSCTLEKLLEVDSDIVGGYYRQRLDNRDIEVYDRNFVRLPYEKVGNEPQLVGALGMGCMLVKSHVFHNVKYPWFVYTQKSVDEIGLSEDVYFCKKAAEAGYQVYLHPHVRCGHHGQRVFSLDDLEQDVEDTSIEDRLDELSKQDLLPQDHVDFLNKIRDDYNWNPAVIYDIGACVLHWTHKAQEVWPGAKIIPFEAMDEVRSLYEREGYRDYHLGVLSDQNDSYVQFNQNLEHPGGNSYYEENPELSPMAKELWTEDNKVLKRTRTLDSVVMERNFPLPDIIKMDVQGAELDILKGAEETLKNARLLILELQHMDYNIGAPKDQEIIDWLYEKGFKVHTPSFSKSTLGVDSDWCFYRFRD